MNKNKKLIAVVKKQLFILGIWTLGAIAGASIMNWYYLIPKLQMETEYVQRGCVSCDTIEESKPEMAEDNLSGGEVAINPDTEGQLDHSDSSSQSVIKKVAQEEGIDWKLLWAVCMVESGCKNTVGDGGQSHGAFQIYAPAHPNITLAQANDIEFSAKWTAQHGKVYKDNPALFAKNHNGIAKTTNQWYVDKVLAIYSELK